MAIQRIRQSLESMNDGEMFSTRDMLGHGKRNPVDLALHRLNRSGEITRLAFGLYMKGGETTTKPSIEEIARAKAAAYHRKVALVNKELAAALSLPLKTESAALFITSGRSRSIWSCHGPIQFIGSAFRKVVMGDSPVGIDLRTVWHLGKRCAEAAVPVPMVKDWGANQWDECEARIKQLPQWLSEWVCLPAFRPGAAQYSIS